MDDTEKSAAMVVAERVVLASGAVALTTGLKLAIGAWAASDEDAFFFGVVALVAWLGGARAGFLAVVLAAASQAYFFIPPAGFEVADTAKLVTLGSWMVEGLLLCHLMGRLSAARDKADEATHDARRGERALRVLFDASPVPMVALDAQTSQFVAVNDSAAALYGRTKEQLLTMRVDDVRDRESVDHSDEEIVHHRAVDGTPLALKLNARPGRFDGRAVRIIIIERAKAGVSSPRSETRRATA